jgi:hypothetical protein
MQTAQQQGKGEGQLQNRELDTTKGIVSVKNPKEPDAAPKEFSFDCVFDDK